MRGSSEQTVDLRLPDGFGEAIEALERTERDVVVMHAHLDLRATEVAAMLAVRDSLELGLEPMVFAASRQRVSFLIQSTLERAGLVISRRTYEGATVFNLRDAPRIWVADQRSLDEPPFSDVDRVYVIGAQSLDPRAGRIVGRHGRLFFAEPTLYGHWVRGVIADPTTTVCMLDAAAICRMFPDQRARVLPGNDPMYERTMLLKDVPVRYTTSSFLSFARDRLKVRTDKNRTLLDEIQQAEAREQHGTPIVSFRMNRLQHRYLAAKRLAVSQGKTPWYLVLKSRRVGMTTLEQAISYHVAVTQPHSYVATLAHEKAQTTRSFQIAKLFAERDQHSPGVKAETQSLIHFDNGSMFFIGTAGGRTFGRGDTLQRGHGSEAAYWCKGPNQNEDAGTLVAGLQGAASNGELVLETTANGHNWYYWKWSEAVAGTNEFTPIFLPWFEDPMNRLPAGSFNPTEITDTLSDEEREIIQRHGLDLNQIAFRRVTQRKFGVLFPQEYPEDANSAFLSYGTCFFSVAAIARLQKRLQGPVETHEVLGGKLHVWHRPMEGHRYAIGVDTSEGVLGGDFGVIAILDLTTGQQAARMRGMFSPRLMGDHIAKVLTMYPGIVAVERESFGNAVLLRLADLGISRPHYHGGPLYYFGKDRAGWVTNESTRSTSLDALAESLIQDDAESKIHDDAMLSECISFRLQKSGKFEADKNAHDDCVMAWAIAHAMARATLPKPRIHIVDDEDSGMAGVGLDG